MKLFIFILCFLFVSGNWDTEQNKCEKWGSWSKCSKQCQQCKWCFDANWEGPVHSTNRISLWDSKTGGDENDDYPYWANDTNEEGKEHGVIEYLLEDDDENTGSTGENMIYLPAVLLFEDQRESGKELKNHGFCRGCKGGHCLNSPPPASLEKNPGYGQGPSWGQSEGLPPPSPSWSPPPPASSWKTPGHGQGPSWGRSEGLPPPAPSWKTSYHGESQSHAPSWDTTLPPTPYGVTGWSGK